MKESLPVLDKGFWRGRYKNAQKLGPKHHHKAVYDISDEVWDRIQLEHGEILQKFFHPYIKTSVLDAGCGMGHLAEILPDNINYIGVDISPEFVTHAQRSHPNRTFEVGDISHLRFPDHSFDLCICRSVRSMIVANYGDCAWRPIEKELLRVSNRLITLDYGDTKMYRVHDAHPEPGMWAGCVTLEKDGGKLVYRPGQDGTVELYDVFVSEDNRRRGIASQLINTVVGETFGTIYGFTQIDNEKIHNLYAKLGFELVRIPRFYRGIDAIMVLKDCTPGRK